MVKKAQMPVGQIFIYILAIVIISLLLLFGYRAIRGFIVKEEVISFTQFKTSLENDVKKMATRYGSSQVFTYEVPGNYDEVCFLDYRCGSTLTCSVLDPFIQSAIDGNIAERIFLRINKLAKEKIAIATDITVEDKLACFNVTNGRISIRLEGTGRETLVKEV